MEDRVSGPGRLTRLLGRGRECAVLDGLLDDVREGRSRSLVLRGEAGIGKTALLAYLIESASDVWVLRAAGVESDMELAYAGLQQLCALMLDWLAQLPAPQRQALQIVFGLDVGAAPDRFLVGLATLSMLSAAGEERPVLWIVDDAQWLDQSSALTLAFVARRLLAERVGLVFAAREPADQLRHLSDLPVTGLHNGDARALLSSAARFRLDDQVRDRIVAETRGNPLALVELPRSLSAAELAGFGTGSFSTLPMGIEEGFRRQLAMLPEETQQLLLIAAADPLGEPIVVWQAAELQGISLVAGAPAAEAGLCEFDARVRFRHPLIRAAAYTTQPSAARRRAHAAIAEVTDAATDPDRRAWHLALAAAGPNDAVADELEQSAARARARGGEAAAAAFLERASALTFDPARRAQRALAAADAKYLAGAAEDALRLAAVAERGPLNEFHRARVEVLRGRVATMQRRAADAPPLLLGAARQLEGLDRRLARETYRDAYVAGIFAGRFAGDTGLLEVAAAIRSATPPVKPGDVTDELLDAAASLIDGGWAAGAQSAQRALANFGVASISDELDLQWLYFAARMFPIYLWDAEAWDTLSGRVVERVRDADALALLPMAIATRVGWELFAGDLAAASTLVAEQDAVQEAISGDSPPGSRLAVAAFRGRESEVEPLVEAVSHDAVARGDGPLVALMHFSTAVLCNGLGRYDEALQAAELGAAYPYDLVSDWVLSELVEAAARCGQPDAAGGALGRLQELAHACGTDWILGVEIRARALVADPADAEELHRHAIEHLGRTPFRTELARARLLYGEWLRRRGRRLEARAELRTAHRMFTEIGMEAFTERARKELAATGEHARKRTVETRDDLTAQEGQIAQLAREGLSNPEIGSRLFLSPRTVEWHLRKVFGKLGIRSRHQLATRLAAATADVRSQP